MSQMSSLNIVNASGDNPVIVASLSDTAIPFYTIQNPINYQSFIRYNNPSGATPLIIVSASDTTHSLFQGNFDLKPGEIYSLFISGQAKALDTIFVRDVIPFYGDSSAGVRFVNLSDGKLPVTVNLEGNSSSNEFSNIAYRDVTPFKTYSAAGGISSYNFEIRDQASGDLLTTFTWNVSVYHNHTLVMTGSTDSASTTPFTVFAVNNY